MKYNDIILLLLILTFILLSLYYIGCVCEFKIASVTEAFANDKPYVGDTSCLDTTLVNIIEPCVNCNNMTTTYDALKKNDPKSLRKYHTDYTCTKITGSTNEYNIDNENYKFDIRNQHLLLTYKCVKLAPKELGTKLNSKGISTAYSNTLEFKKNGTDFGTGLTNDIIRAQITAEIKKMMVTANNNQGPIYACISQAPFLKGQKARFDIVQHGKGCYDNGRACGDTEFLKYEILLIFLDNDKTKITNFIQMVADNTSRNALCFLNCGGIDDMDTLTMGCGCLNKTDSYINADKSKYTSVCLAPDSDFAGSRDTVSKQADYSIIYFLNPHNKDGVLIYPWEQYM
jgi:hypothetical protein